MTRVSVSLQLFLIDKAVLLRLVQFFISSSCVPCTQKQEVFQFSTANDTDGKSTWYFFLLRILYVNDVWVTRIMVNKFQVGLHFPRIFIGKLGAREIAAIRCKQQVCFLFILLLKWMVCWGVILGMQSTKVLQLLFPGGVIC